MASSIGDIIPELSTSTPINVAQSWISKPFVVGQYNSMIINVKTDTNCTLNVYWSGDGVNYDFVIPELIGAGISEQKSITCSNKWIKIELINSGIVNQTYLRLYTYAVSTNNTSQVSFPNDASVTVKNLPVTSFGYGVTTIQDQTYIQNVFNNYNVSSMIPNGGYTGINPITGFKETVIGVNPDIKRFYYYYAPASVGTSISNTQNELKIHDCGSDNILVPLTPNDYQYYLFYPVLHTSPFTTVIGEYTCKIERSTHTSSGGSQILFGIGDMNIDYSDISDGIFFGYYSTNSTVYSNFGILYINSASGNRIFYEQPSWNVDPANGSKRLPLTDWSKYNNFKILINYACGLIFCYVYNTIYNEMTLVHTINIMNSSSNPIFSCINNQLILYQKCTKGTVLSSDSTKGLTLFYVGLSYNGTFTDGGDLLTVYTPSPNLSLSPPTLSNIITIRVPLIYNGNTLNSVYHVNNLKITKLGNVDSISFVYISRNNTIDPSYPNLTVWNNVYDSSPPYTYKFNPLEYNIQGATGFYETGSITVGNIYKGGSTLDINLEKYFIHLSRGDIFSVCVKEAYPDSSTKYLCEIGLSYYN